MSDNKDVAKNSEDQEVVVDGANPDPQAAENSTVQNVVEEIISKSMISTQESKVAMKDLRNIIKDPDMKDDLKEMGVNLDEVGRRPSSADLIEIIGPLSEKLVESGTLGDKEFIENEKNDGSFEKSADELKKILGGKGVESFEALTDKQQKSAIIFIDTPSDAKEQSIKDAAEASRKQTLEEENTNKQGADTPSDATPSQDEPKDLSNNGGAATVLVDNSSFADSLENNGEQTPEGSFGIEINWDEGAQQLTANFQNNTGNLYVEPKEPSVSQDSNLTFQV